MELQLEIDGIQAQRGGRLWVYLFGPQGFPKEHRAALQKTAFDLSGAKLVATLETQLAGEVAIKIVHDDEGRDGDIRKRFGFFPDMGIGYSKGARITWRLPRFNESALRLDPEAVRKLRVPIQMQYLFQNATRNAKPGQREGIAGKSDAIVGRRMHKEYHL
ncbi:MAG: DUF2141 domain-containing protein [bacterium]|nr:DUF2141 domain-containing protein [bacterium]